MQDLVPWAVWLLELAVVAATVAGMGGVLAKSGSPAWGVLVPVWNLVLLARAGKEVRVAQRVIGLLVPGVNVFVFAQLGIDVARRFGRGTAFGLGLTFLPFVTWPLLGLGSARRVNP